MNDANVEIISRTWLLLFAGFAGGWFVCSILYHLTVQVIIRNRRVKREQELAKVSAIYTILGGNSK
jgi:hypothetical protein